MKEKELKYDLKIYLEKMENILSEYVGAKIQTSIHKTNNKEKMEINITAQFPIDTGIMLDELTKEILSHIRRVIENFVTERQLDNLLLQTITYDTSLSLIFAEYLDDNVVDKYEKIHFINDLIEIGAFTYESQPANIGIVYCPNHSAMSELNNLEFDIVNLPNKKGLKHFFISEKPFLRLVNNRSLALVLNKDFEIVALIRKKKDEKNIENILENYFNNLIIPDVVLKVNNSLIDKFEEISLKQSDNDKVYNVLRNFIKLLKNNTPQNLENKCIPLFVYFKIRNKKICIFTKNNFIITNYFGQWKIKHYNILFASILRFILIHVTTFVIQNKNYIEYFNKLTCGVQKLLRIFQNLSYNNSSAIFVILPNDEINMELTDKEVKQLLNKPIFNNKAQRDYLKVIKNNKYYVNISNIDSFLIESISSVDGAVILDTNLNILSFGEIIKIPKDKNYKDTFGTGSIACKAASEYGISIKISEDGEIILYIFERQVLVI